MIYPYMHIIHAWYKTSTSPFAYPFLRCSMVVSFTKKLAWLVFNSTYQSMFLVYDEPKNIGFYKAHVILRIVEPLKKHVQIILANSNTIDAWQQLTSLLTILPASKIHTYCCPGRQEGLKAKLGLDSLLHHRLYSTFIYFLLSSVLITMKTSECDMFRYE